jgi:hypothetical protein
MIKNSTAGSGVLASARSNWIPPPTHRYAVHYLDQCQPVFVKGANWIPDDHFLTRITAERIERRLDQAIAANINMLRDLGRRNL